jgi:hypothetical protein
LHQCNKTRRDDKLYQDRTSERLEAIVDGAADAKDSNVELERLAYSKIEGPAVTLAFMADDKNYVCLVFHLRSLNLDGESPEDRKNP